MHFWQCAQYCSSNIYYPLLQNLAWLPCVYYFIQPCYAELELNNNEYIPGPEQYQYVYRIKNDDIVSVCL